ncbi:hypothetical protein, partial [Nocardia abscessus]|uniref:hypothetical protein n=1 Tax=Nocardia abscessus TaxID=120957 RepID=UPI002454A2CF
REQRQILSNISERIHHAPDLPEGTREQEGDPQCPRTGAPVPRPPGARGGGGAPPARAPPPLPGGGPRPAPPPPPGAG